jgi:hypothetical protein
MAKRKDPKVKATESGTDQADTPDNGVAGASAPLASVPSPLLIPPQVEWSASTAAAGQPAPSRQDETAPQTTVHTADVVTVSFAEAAAEAASKGSESAPANTVHRRPRRLLPLAATIAVAAAVGGMAGSLATSGISTLIAADHTAQPTAALEDGRPLQEAIAQLGADLTALRTKIDESAKSAGAQLSRLGERLDRADRAQADSAAKLAKLAESFEHRAATASQPADPATTGSIGVTSPAQVRAAARPAGQPIVEGWTLRNVYNGAAVIQGRIGLVEVEPGDTIPGLGRIETIRRQDGRWVVVTNRGLVIAR